MRAIRSLQLSKGAAKEKIVPIEFPAWRDGPVFRWYDSLDNNAGRVIERLQIRKDTSGVVPHRFIIIHMHGGSVHRLDRRPADNINSIDVLKNEAVPTKDELIPFVDRKSLDEVEGATKCEIELTLGGHVDLEVILSACYGIVNDPSANKYTLFAHNCFFFSWTILMVVSRHCLPYQVPKPESLLKRAKDILPDLTSYIVEEVVSQFLEMVIDVVTIFRRRAGNTIHEGMHFIGRALWRLPTSVLQFSWRKIFRARLHFGLRRQLEKRVLAQLEQRIIPLWQNGLNDKQTPKLLDAQLWLDRLHTLIEPILKKEITLILWDSILDAISAGYGNVEDSRLAEDLMNPNLKFSLMGRNATQFYAVWGAALHGALPAAYNAAYGKYSDGAVSDADVFDLAWNAGRDAGLISAKQVVANTRHLMAHPELRDKMWSAIWDIWEPCWQEAHQKAQQGSIATVSRIASKLLETGVKIVVEELGDSKAHAIPVRILDNVCDVFDGVCYVD